MTHSRLLLAIVAALSILSFTTSPVRASQQSEEHVVPLSDLQRDVNFTASQRARNLADIDRVLSAPVAQEQLSKANVSSVQVKAAISHLDDKELARLADRARAANQDVRGGDKGTVLFIVGLTIAIFLIVTLTQVL
jgi:hypothetical protein